MENDKEPLFQMEDCKVKMLSPEEDIEDVLRLCQNCLDYYELEGVKSVGIENAQEIFEGLPEGKTSEDKMVIGFYGEKDNLIGIIEGIRGFPQKDIWYIGLMIIVREKRNEGLGEKFYKAFEKWSSEHDVKSIRLGVLEKKQLV